MKTKMKTFRATPASQRGVAMVLVTIAMLVLIGMSGLALDMGHAYLNKTRLQNALDAAALSGAKTLDQNPGDFLLAEEAAKNTFFSTAKGGGNQELDKGLTWSDVKLQFAPVLAANQFAYPGAPDSRYVRVSVNNFDKATWFVHVLPGIGDTLTVGGSAVAGPSPTLVDNCRIFPIMLCDGQGGQVEATPIECEDDTGDYVYGYRTGCVYRLELPPGNYSDVGPGNFRFLSVGGSGGNVLRDNLAGRFDECTSNIVEYCDGQPCYETQPGQVQGAMRGVNTRFGKYGQGQGQGNMSSDDYPPDTNTRENIYYSEYKANPVDIADNSGVPLEKRVEGKREIVIPIGDCSGDNSGKSEINLVNENSYVCALLTRTVDTTGAAADRAIYAEISGTGCLSSGVPGTNPATGPGPYKIQLYQDPLSTDS